MKLIAIDPGTTTGYAVFIDGKLTEFGTIKKEDFFGWVETLYDFDLVVENFRIRPAYFKGKRAATWNSPFALEAIGALRGFTFRSGKRFILQEPSQRVVGYGFAGIPYKKGAKHPHHLDAIAHGFFYLVRQEGWNPEQLRELQKSS